MHIRCPNCERPLDTEAPSDDERYTCSGCNRLIYVDAQRVFPAISAMTYPGTNLDAQPLKSFFFMATAQALAPEDKQATLKTSSLAAEPESSNPDPPPSVTVSPQVDGNPVNDPLVPAEDKVPPPVLTFAASLTPASAVADELPIQAVSAGTFAPTGPAAMGRMPPPRPVNLGGLVTPPWEQVGPPPLAKTHDEGWSVPNPGAPPPVPKRNDADEFARALGLPDLGSLGVHHAASNSRPVMSNEEPEESTPRRSLTWLYVLIGASVLTGGAVFAALRIQPKPLSPKIAEDVPAPTQAATQPASQMAAKTDKSPARTDALEHYSLGNKLYLQKKLPAAVDEFKKAVELDATFGLAHRGLGVAYASQGKGELAIKEYKAYLRISPDAKDAKQVEALVKNFEK